MAKQRKAKKAKVAPTVHPSTRNYLRKIGLVVLAALCVGIGFAAYAENVRYHGHVSITRHLSPSSVNGSSPADAAKSTEAAVHNQRSNLVDMYGDAARSPVVAGAIKSVLAASPSKGAVASADAFEALEHGRWSPRTDQNLVIMSGYVPPGMPPEQAAVLYRSLPHLPKIPGMMTPQRVAEMAGEPVDPQDAVMQSVGVSRQDVEAANQKLLESSMRERYGPLYTPPLHADHSWLAEHAVKSGNAFKFTQDFDGSIREMTNSSGSIVSEYSYDPWGVPTQIAGSGPTPDFLFQGMYYHQRSGLYLPRHRAYNPALGRFLSRDPIGERGGTNLYAFVGNNPISYRDPTGLGPVTAATWGATGAQIGWWTGGGTGLVFSAPEGGVGAVAGAYGGAALGGALGAGLGWLAPDPSFSTPQLGGGTFCAASKPGSKPKDAPPGTKPIDQSGLGHEDIEKVKDGVGAGAADWTGIAPNGDVITSDSNGNAVNNGHYGDYLPWFGR